MTSADGRRIRVCGAGDLPDGQAVRVPRRETGTDDAITVFRDGDRYWALNDTCTHGGASLADGWIEAGTVECPLHGGVFALEDGSAQAAPALRGTVTHEVRVSDGAVWLCPRGGCG